MCSSDLMCGRFYVDDQTARAIDRLIRRVDRELRGEAPQAYRGDIYPSGKSTILLGRHQELADELMSWGFPQQIGRASCRARVYVPV